MNILLRIMFLVFCFVAAIVCYKFGVPFGGWIFIALGLYFEGMFWVKILGKRKYQASNAANSPGHHEHVKDAFENLCNQRVQWVAEGFSGDLSLLRSRAKEVATELGAPSVDTLAGLFHSESERPPELSHCKLKGQWMVARQFAIFEIFYNLGECALPVLRRTAFGEYDWTQGNAVEILCRLAADGLQTDEIIADLYTQLPLMREEAHFYALRPLLSQAKENSALQQVIDQLLIVPEFKSSFVYITST